MIDQIPPMTPSARERLVMQPSGKYQGRDVYIDTSVIRLQETAYRDGFAAGKATERAKIAADLRDLVLLHIATHAFVRSWGGDPDAPCLASSAMPQPTMAASYAGSISASLRATADYLESQS